MFNLAEPTYDFITDSYQASKPYVLSVAQKKAQAKAKTGEMLDLISYLGGEKKQVAPSDNKFIHVKLEGSRTIVQEQKANAFLHRIEHYISNPNELAV